MTGIRTISEGDRWSVRAAVKAAWNIELAAVGAVAEIGPVVADSAHRAALRASTDMWSEFQQYTDQASEHPTDRPRLWDTFAARWSSTSVQDQSEVVRARLAGEAARMRAILRGESPSSAVIAAAAAQASIGQIIVQNQIVVPSGPRNGVVTPQVASTQRGDGRSDAPSGSVEPRTTGANDEIDGAGGPEQDPHDTRKAVWIGKRIYLGNDTEVSRLFWLLAKPLGAARTLGEVQRAIDGMETDADSGADEWRRAAQRVRKVVSKLRAAVREAELDDHVLIVRGGSNAVPEYSMVWRYSR